MSHPKSTKDRPITYADEPFQFEVNVEDVKGSVVADPENCAGACALRKRPDVVRAWVARTRTVIEFTDGRRLRWKNPAALQETVEKFDSTAGLFPPDTYLLTPVGPGMRSKTRSKHSDTGTRPGSSRKRPSHALR